MDFPHQKMRFTTNHGGRNSRAGWLVLDVESVDLESVTQLYVDLAEVDRLREKGDEEAAALDQAKKLLGG